MRTRTLVLGSAALGVAALLVVADRAGLVGSEPAGQQVSNLEGDAPTLVDVRRGDLSTTHEFAASVDFGEPRTLHTEASGTITSDRSAGQVVGHGEELARIDEQPIFLGAGAMPLYRELFKVDTHQKDENGDRLELMSGADVSQLQTFLVAQGFDAKGRLEIDGAFGGITEGAVEAWQKSVGHSPTGRVDTTQLVFSPQPVRFSVALQSGDRFEGLQVANSEAQVLVDTSNRDRGALRVGESVRVELVDGVSFDGLILKQQQVDSGGSRVWRTTVETSALLDGDVTTATVTVTEVVASDVLIVPVGALLALAEGGFAVEVVVAGSSELVAVEVGEVVEAQAEVLGDLHNGDSIVVTR